MSHVVINAKGVLASRCIFTQGIRIQTCYLCGWDFYRNSAIFFNWSTVSQFFGQTIGQNKYYFFPVHRFIVMTVYIDKAIHSNRVGQIKTMKINSFFSPTTNYAQNVVVNLWLLIVDTYSETAPLTHVLLNVFYVSTPCWRWCTPKYQ